MAWEEGSGVNRPGLRGRWTGWPWWEARGHDKAAQGHTHLLESEEMTRPQLQCPAATAEAKGCAQAAAYKGWAGSRLMEDSLMGGRVLVC